MIRTLKAHLEGYTYKLPMSDRYAPLCIALSDPYALHFQTYFALVRTGRPVWMTPCHFKTRTQIVMGFNVRNV